jgi:hypothetical protein
MNASIFIKNSTQTSANPQSNLKINKTITHPKIFLLLPSNIFLFQTNFIEFLRLSEEDEKIVDRFLRVKNIPISIFYCFTFASGFCSD